MPYGYNGRILEVDLSTREVSIRSLSEEVYRKYLGGGALAGYLLRSEWKPQADPLGPGNTLVFAASVVTGAPCPGFARFSVSGRSPLTGTIVDSQAGGFFGPEMKFAGFDAIVFRGEAAAPCYLWVHDGEAELRDAAHLWGLETGPTHDAIRAELGDQKIRVACIGPGGEQGIRYANIGNELSFYNGRGGLGAVMGAKRLKAVAVRGTRALRFAEPEVLKEMARRFARDLPNSPLATMKTLGTGRAVRALNAAGGLPTRNFSAGSFAGAERISSEAIHETIFTRRHGCWACPVTCKQSVSAREPWPVDERYGGPEYETLASFGSYLCVEDVVAIAKANEICNRYGLDTISAGACIAFAMDCFEAGILTPHDTYGLELRFGNTAAAMALLEKIVRREEGLGWLLGEGVARAAAAIGRGAERFAVHVKGRELPAHMPAHKPSLALAYGTGVIGPDHMSSIHDPIVAPGANDTVFNKLAPLGIGERVPLEVLDGRKVELFRRSYLYGSGMESLALCLFCFVPYGLFGAEDLLRLVRAATGWDFTLDELLAVGERRLNLFRLLSLADGVGVGQERLPFRLHQALAEGAGQGGGRRITEEDYERARRLYYERSGWDENGVPRPEKLAALGL
ncbi:MAG: aldehyde ferredoxin oxidoreductase family protein [Betaproteobacteria bacterium]